MSKPKSQAIAAAQTSARGAAFIDAILAGSNPTAAARAAGYSDPANSGRALIRHPQVRRALAEAAQAQLESDLVPLSLRVAREILTDDDPKAKAVRAKLALGILDRASKGQALADVGAGELQKLTTDQLAELVAKGMAAQAAEANTLDVTPRTARTAEPRFDDTP